MLNVQRLPKISVRRREANKVEIDADDGFPDSLLEEVLRRCVERFGFCEPTVPKITERIRGYIKRFLRAEMEASRLIHLGGDSYAWRPVPRVN